MIVFSPFINGTESSKEDCLIFQDKMRERLKLIGDGKHLEGMSFKSVCLPLGIRIPNNEGCEQESGETAFLPVLHDVISGKTFGPNIKRIILHTQDIELKEKEISLIKSLAK